MVESTTNINSSTIKTTVSQAKEIALAKVGGGVITDFSQDFDKRISKYEVSVRNGNTEYEFEISAVDGTILSREVDRETDLDDKFDDWD